jgi:hypothetical protein
MISRRRLPIIGFFLLLLIVDWVLYFRHANHFFQGDTIFLLNHRAHSVSEFFREFNHLNPSGWYRPLANELLESILFPIAGLNTVPYRIPVYLVFVAITVAVYALGVALTGRRVAGAIAASFFTIHTTNAYVTYDLGFMPELLFTVFYLSAILAYWRYLREKNEKWLVLSTVFFAGGLLSKESAVTLPAILLLIAILFPAQTLRDRLVFALRSTAPHIVVLVVYLAVAVGYLQVMNLSLKMLFDSSQKPNPGDYIAVLNSGVLTNAALAWTWAFNLPHDLSPPWSVMSPAMIQYLKAFRVLVMALATVVLIFSRQRRVILLGLAWFWITLIPALPLVAHFMAYYLFLPVVGLSLVVGVGFTWLYDRLRQIQPVLAAAVIVLIFAGGFYVSSRIIRTEIRENGLLGASARIASNTLNDLKNSYPSLPESATLYFADAKQPLIWHHDFGGLIRMAYSNDRIRALYQSQGDELMPEMENTLVFDVRNERLLDQTRQYRFNPLPFMRFAESDQRLDVTPSEVVAGRDKYTLHISRLNRIVVRIAYTIDNGPLEAFTTELDANGKVTFDVGQDTRHGRYSFLAFKAENSNDWIRSDETLKVR